GTVRYLSPEQVSGEEVDHRTDLYSAGVVLYELLTGRPPFVAETDIATAMVRLTVDPAPPRSLAPGIPRPVEAAVLRAMARSPDQRFQSAEAMRAVLDRWAAPDHAEPVTPLPSTASVPAAPRRRGGTFRSWMLVPLLLLLVAAGAVVAGLALG